MSTIEGTWKAADEELLSMNECCRMRAVRVLLLLVLAFGVALAAPVPSASASAGTDYQDSSSSGASVGSAGPGGVPIVVSVEFSTASGGSAGSGVVSASVEAVVLPVCGYREGSTGASLARFLTSQAAASTAATVGESLADWQEPYPGFETYASDEEGHWFMPRCWRDRASDMDEAAYRDMERAFVEANGPVYVPAGSEPPVGVVDGRTLAQAAWDAVVVPSPEVGYNPSLGESGYTLVGWFTVGVGCWWDADAGDCDGDGWSGVGHGDGGCGWS